MDEKSMQVLQYLVAHYPAAEFKTGIHNEQTKDMLNALSLEYNELKGVFDYLSQEGYIAYTENYYFGPNNSFHLTHKGRNYKAFARIDKQKFRESNKYLRWAFIISVLSLLISLASFLANFAL